MNFKEINESLNKPFKFYWAMRTKPRGDMPGKWVASFDAGDLDRPMDIIVHIWQQNGWKRANVEFLDKSLDHEQALGKTGRGLAFRVFATVAHVVLSVLKQNKDIMSVDFSADKKDGPGRTKLYKRFAKSIPGFEYAGYDKTFGDIAAIRKGAPDKVWDYYEEFD